MSGLCDTALGGSCVTTEIFAKGTVPTESCTCHIAVNVCEESGKFATEYCPETESVVYLIKEETSETYDTPNILPSGDDTTCTIHTSEGSTQPGTEGFNDLYGEDFLLPEGDDEGESNGNDILWIEP